MNIKKLYVNGCSWTDGDVLDLARLVEIGTGRNYSYPTLVANEFGYNLIDESRYGGSINRIVRMCWNYIMTNDITNTIFILEIPNGFRDEIYSNKFERYFNVTGGNLNNPHDKTENNKEWYEIKNDVVDTYFNFLNFEEFNKKEYINLMGLISYIKQHTRHMYLIQPYEMINKYNIFNQLITDVNIIKLSDNTFKINEYNLIQDMCKNEELSLGHELNKGTEDTHPGISGHKKLSEIIIEHLINNDSNSI